MGRFDYTVRCLRILKFYQDERVRICAARGKIQGKSFDPTKIVDKEKCYYQYHEALSKINIDYTIEIFSLQKVLQRK